MPEFQRLLALEVIWLCCFAVVRLSAQQQGSGESVTNLGFYLHDEVSGPNPTVTAVAGVSNGFGFGAVMVIDDLMTEGPSPTSKSIGRAQGTYMMSAMDKSSLLFTVTAVFSDRNGTLSFHGADRFLLRSREIAVVGGTGIYRFATGYAVITTYSTNNLSAVLHFDVNFRHSNVLSLNSSEGVPPPAASSSSSRSSSPAAASTSSASDPASRFTIGTTLFVLLLVTTSMVNNVKG